MSKLEVYIKDPDIADPDKKVKTMQSDVVYMCGSIVHVFREASRGDLLLEFQMLYNVYNTIDTRFDEILTLLKEKKEKK